MSHKTDSTKKNDLLFWIAIIFIAVIAMAIFWFSTPYGLALVNDSVNYIDGARNIVQGHGYSRILGDGSYQAVTNFPPLYSFFIAGLLLLGIDGIHASWWLSFVLFGINLILIGWLGRKATSSVLFGIVTVILFLICEPFLNFHTFALSEPVFIFTFSLTLIFLIKFLESKNWFWIVFCGVFASFAYLTRYIGASLFATALIACVIFIPELKKKITSVLFFIAGAVPSVAAWTVRNIIQTGSATNRQNMWHTIPAEKIDAGVRAFWTWLIPERYDLIDRMFDFWKIALYAGIIVFILVIVLLTIRYWIKKNKPQIQQQMVWVFATQVVIYFLMLTFTLLCLDASVNYEARILMPIYNMLLLLIVVGLSWLWNHSKLVFKLGAVVIFLVLSLSFIEDTLDTIKLNRSQGQGFMNEYWTETQIFTELANYPDRFVYTNKPRAVNLFLERGAFILPSPINPSTGQSWIDYKKNVESIQQKVLDGEGVMVIFGYKEIILNTEDKAWLEYLTKDLPVLAKYPEGMIFGVDE